MGAGKIEDCSFDGKVDGCIDSDKVVGIAVVVTVGVILTIAGICLSVQYCRLNKMKKEIDKVIDISLKDTLEYSGTNAIVDFPMYRKAEDYYEHIIMNLNKNNINFDSYDADMRALIFGTYERASVWLEEEYTCNAITGLEACTKLDFYGNLIDVGVINVHREFNKNMLDTIHNKIYIKIRDLAEKQQNNFIKNYFKATPHNSQK